MAFHVYQPQSTHNVDQKVAIVTANHLGARLATDAGDDAQSLANAIGLRVIGFDRPIGSAHTPASYVRQLHRLAAYVHELAADQGARRLIAVGRSAGATALLAIAQTSIEFQGGITAVEPIGWRKQSIHQGLHTWLSYSKRQAALMADVAHNPDLVRPTTSQRSPAEHRRMQRDGLVDLLGNAAIWNTPVAFRATSDITRNQRLTPLHLIFANDSFVIDPETRDWLELTLPIVRPDNSAPVSVETIPNTTHASFDNRDYFAQIIRPSIEQTLAS